ncbi:MAG TPA: DUF4352 domain-containing protein [Clostridiales bacterium]|jgi:hypothetical protein|nr:DUF4352 domain-containing protein [Clostridiales bacterium]
MKKVLILILILTCVFFLFSGCDDVKPEKVEGADRTANTSQQSDGGETQEKTQTETETQPKTETYKIGDSVKAGNLIFTVNSTRTDEGSDFIKPKDGHIYHIVDVTVENAGDKSETVSSLMMFKLLDSDGYNYSVTFGPETKGAVDGEISAGRKLRGELVFEVPEDATGLELEIDPTVFGSGQIIIELAEE